MPTMVARTKMHNNNGSSRLQLGHRRGSVHPRHRRSARIARKTILHVFLGGVLSLYFVSTLVVQPGVHSKRLGEKKGSRQRAAEKHSPLMLLREREQARRRKEQQQQQHPVVEKKKEAAGGVPKRDQKINEQDEKKAAEVFVQDDDDNDKDGENNPEAADDDDDEKADGNGEEEGNDEDEDEDGGDHDKKPPAIVEELAQDKNIPPQEVARIEAARAKMDAQQKQGQPKTNEKMQKKVEGQKGPEAPTATGKEQQQQQQQQQQTKKEDQQEHSQQQQQQQQDQQKHSEQQQQQQQQQGATNQQEVKPQQGEKPKAPKRERKLARVPHNAKEAPIEGDPLRATVWDFPREKIPIKPAVPYLGTLIDAGRHYFPIEWLKKVVDRLADMNYNLIHLRLTDDQTFNVLLKSRPELAYPTAVDNPSKAVYSVEELRDLTAYAKARGIQFMPEVNVPGHAGSWAGIPDMIVQCPGFICDKGYGLPLNVKHRELRPILTDIIKEIVDIFDDPPFLHLGGDEVNMADPCFRETHTKVFDYPAFEQELKQIIKDSGYPEERVVRWEMTGQKALDRAGGIEQFWESHPGDRHEATGPFFVSTWMYFDTNGDQNSYEVYTKAKKSFNLKGGKLPTAIIAGTFELSTEFWYDRNILGRLLSVALGASNQSFTAEVGKNNKVDESQVVMSQWRKYCTQLGLGDIICLDTDGGPVIATAVYRRKWRERWDVWKRDICERLTESAQVRMFKSTGREYPQAIAQGTEFFWKKFPMELPVKEVAVGPQLSLSPDLTKLEKHTIPHTGVILDAVSAMPKISRVHTIIKDYIAKLGFNLVQLRLVSEYGFVFQPETQQQLAHSILATEDSPLYSLKPELSSLIGNASALGIEMMPEISVSTDAGGWFNGGTLANCPLHYCAGKGTPNNINQEYLLPVLFSVVGELREVFTSKYIHLGTDEREASMACFEEAKIEPDFDSFEHKLETLMALADLDSEEILRSENTERIRYSERAGRVTQYPAGVMDVRQDEPFFLTVDIFDGNAYDVFQNTKKAVALKPRGVLAEIRKLNNAKWVEWSIPKRLLAFSMGVSEIANYWSIYDSPSFESYFTRICQELNLDEDCSPPGVFDVEITVITESQEFTEKSCNIRTHVHSQRIAKPVKPFYEAKVSALTT